MQYAQICSVGSTVEYDFTVEESWDQYPIVGHLLAIWNATGEDAPTHP
jgi:hypothetical protein